jgi:ABC-type multidrug transport system ATPase subunit
MCKSVCDWDWALSRIIKNVGRKLRMMVISHIYEPRNDVLYEMDYLVMMAKGKVLYAGTPQDARPFFTKLRAPAYPAQNLCEFSQVRVISASEVTASR